jgi:transcriptional regulator with XRE-family HTH domain
MTTRNKPLTDAVRDAHRNAYAERGITHRQVAERLGIARSTYRAKLRGDRNWTGDEVARIEDLLQVPKRSLYELVRLGDK